MTNVLLGCPPRHLADMDKALGAKVAARVYKTTQGWPWPDVISFANDGRKVRASFKPFSGTNQVVSDSSIKAITSGLVAAGIDRIGVHHEPENDGWSQADFKSAFTHTKSVIKSVSDLKVVEVFMDWSFSILNGAVKKLDSHGIPYVDDAFATSWLANPDEVALDGYNWRGSQANNGWASPSKPDINLTQSIFQPFLDFAKKNGFPQPELWEFGSAREQDNAVGIPSRAHFLNTFGTWNANLAYGYSGIFPFELDQGEDGAVIFWRVFKGDEPAAAAAIKNMGAGTVVVPPDPCKDVKDQLAIANKTISDKDTEIGNIGTQLTGAKTCISESITVGKTNPKPGVVLQKVLARLEKG